MNVTPDLFNGLFEITGGLFILLSIRKLWSDKLVRGVSWVHVSFFVAWGYWNLYYYPSLDQWWSFWGGVGVVTATTAWLVQLIYYSYRPGGGKDGAVR